MANLKLDSSNDLVIENANWVIVTGADAIAQDCNTRLQTFKNEYFLDRRIGVPYFEKILGAKPRYALLRSLFRKAIFTTPGIINIFDFTITYTGLTRTLSMSFRAETESGPFVYDKELII